MLPRRDEEVGVRVGILVHDDAIVVAAMKEHIRLSAAIDESITEDTGILLFDAADVVHPPWGPDDLPHFPFP